MQSRCSFCFWCIHIRSSFQEQLQDFDMAVLSCKVKCKCTFGVCGRSAPIRILWLLQQPLHLLHTIFFTLATRSPLACGIWVKWFMSNTRSFEKWGGRTKLLGSFLPGVGLFSLWSVSVMSGSFTPRTLAAIGSLASGTCEGAPLQLARQHRSWGWPLAHVPTCPEEPFCVPQVLSKMEV